MHGWGKEDVCPDPPTGSSCTLTAGDGATPKDEEAAEDEKTAVILIRCLAGQGRLEEAMGMVEQTIKQQSHQQGTSVVRVDSLSHFYF